MRDERGKGKKEQRRNVTTLAVCPLRVRGTACAIAAVFRCRLSPSNALGRCGGAAALHMADERERGERERLKRGASGLDTKDSGRLLSSACCGPCY